MSINEKNNDRKSSLSKCEIIQHFDSGPTLGNAESRNGERNISQINKERNAHLGLLLL